MKQQKKANIKKEEISRKKQENIDKTLKKESVFRQNVNNIKNKKHFITPINIVSYSIQGVNYEERAIRN